MIFKSACSISYLNYIYILISLKLHSVCGFFVFIAAVILEISKW